MTRVVFNSCYGGFSLSREACQRYWDLKGQQVWIEDHEPKMLGLFDVWLVSPSERLEQKTSEQFTSMSIDERRVYNKAISEQQWNDRDVDRHDPILVQVVEELGDKANGNYAELSIAEVNGPYRIDEYDGYESVETPNSYDWITP